jgi:hypothetical protein
MTYRETSIKEPETVMRAFDLLIKKAFLHVESDEDPATDGQNANRGNGDHFSLKSDDKAGPSDRKQCCKPS